LVGCNLARVARRATEQPSSEHIDPPVDSTHFGKIRLLSALPLPSPLMAAWCNEHGRGFFFFYSADWVECMARNLAKLSTRRLLTWAKEQSCIVPEQGLLILQSSLSFIDPCGAR
jgi:hypothetical protein